MGPGYPGPGPFLEMTRQEPRETIELTRGEALTMANFTTEADVRLKFQLTDTTLTPAALVEQSIEDAHAEVLRYLNPEYASGPPDAALTLGETLLAGSHALRSLAAKDAFDQKRVSIGSQRIEEGARFASLLRTASEAEEQAWAILGPYLAAYPGRDVAAVTMSVNVLGEE